MDIERIRSDIPALKNVTYVNTGWSGPSSNAVLDAIAGYLRAEAEAGPTSVSGVEMRVEVDRRARRDAAQLLGCEEGEVLLTDNTTEGVNVVIGGLPWQKGDRLVTTSIEHPGIMVPALFATRRHSLDLHVVDCDASASAQHLVDAFDAAVTPGTRLVALSHISYANGLRLPLAEIVEMAHSRGAFVLADGAQTAGQIALDVRSLDIDFYAVPGHKWLCGPDGTGALFIRRDRLEDVSPVRYGYWAAASFDNKGNLEEYTRDARRYQVSTTNGGLWSGFAAAVEFARGLGVDAIEERSVALASYAVRRLMAVPRVRVVSPREGPQVTGLVCFQVDGVEPDGVTASLWERGRVVARSVTDTASTRLSLAFFNTEADIDQAIGVVEDVASRGPVDLEGTDWYRTMHFSMDEI